MDERRWKYYDFDKNWEAFYKVWKTDEVQDALKFEMDNWCEKEAYFVYDEDGKQSRPKWEKGEPLWKLSRTDYWCSKIMDSANEEVEKYDMIRTCRKRLEQIHMRKFDEETAAEWFFANCFDSVMETYEPKNGTIDSLVLFMGKNFLSFPLYLVAVKLFPDSKVTKTYDVNECDLIMIEDEEIVFDLLDFYYTTRDDYKGLLDDSMYDSILDNSFTDSESREDYSSDSTD